MSDFPTHPGPSRASYPPPVGPPHPVGVNGPADHSHPDRSVRSALALVVFAIVLGLVVALLVAAIVGVAVFAIQNALNG
jgi:hypothetical protein